MSGVDALTTLWILSPNVVDVVPGKNSLPLAVMSAVKGVADGHVIQWLTDALQFLSGTTGSSDLARMGIGVWFALLSAGLWRLDLGDIPGRLRLFARVHVGGSQRRARASIRPGSQASPQEFAGAL
jgi:hypothetical protein